MAKRENTAINELIAGVSREQTSTQPVAQFASAPVVAPSAAGAASLNVRPGWSRERGAAHHPLQTAWPATMPVAAPFEARLPSLPISYPVVSRAVIATFTTVADPPSPMPLRTPVPGTTRVSELPELRAPALDERSEPPPSDTVQMPRHPDLRAVVRLIVPIAVLVLAGAAVGSYIAVAGDAPVLFDAQAGASAAARSQPASPRAAQGTLVISSEPPCEIFIDGAPTGLMTPQRSLALAAGYHRIALVNSEAGVEKMVAVELAANATESIIEDLTH